MNIEEITYRVCSFAALEVSRERVLLLTKKNDPTSIN